MIQNPDHVFFWLTNRKTANRVAIESNGFETFQRLVTQRRVHSTLHDTEQCRRAVAMGLFAALSPAQRHFHGILCLLLGGRIRRAFVKNHYDIGAEISLNLHRDLRRELHRGAVHRRTEFHALFTDFAHLAQTEHLEPAGVGQDWPLPLGEIVKVTMLLYNLGTRAQHQVKSVAQNNLSANFFDVTRQHALDRAVSADRHKRWCLHFSTREAECSAAGTAISREGFKRHETAFTHDLDSWTAAAATEGNCPVTNMASP